MANLDSMPDAPLDEDVGDFATNDMPETAPADEELSDVAEDVDTAPPPSAGI